MNEERKQILDMLAAGKISAEDAERLLDKLGHGEASGTCETEYPPAASGEKPKNPKYLRVHVDSADGDKVNIRVPLALIRTGINWTKRA